MKAITVLNEVLVWKKSIQSLPPLTVDTVVVTVYFAATGFLVTDCSTHISTLYQLHECSSPQQMVMGFDGCGVTHGLLGGIFGVGLEDHIEEVVDTVIDLLKQSKKVVLNCVGHSRGGIAALLLAKRLAWIDARWLEINAVLLDPVPGNYLITAQCDVMGISLANQAMDLSECQNLKQVLAIYCNEPLLDIIAHAPLVPLYPPQCQVMEEVLPGDHMSIAYYYGNPEGYICLHLTQEFLSRCQANYTSYTSEENILDTYLDLTKLATPSENPLIIDAQGKIFSEGSIAKKPIKAQTRPCHSYQPTYINTTPNMFWWNSHHKKSNSYTDTDNKRITLKIERNYLAPEMPKKLDSTNFQTLPQTFSGFLDEIETGMSNESRTSIKGNILANFKKEITENSLEDETTLRNALRNVIALALQRDRNPHSFFSTTQTGWKILDLLKKDQYQCLREAIYMGSQPLRYRNLRQFVLGKNDEHYFDAKQRDTLYGFFQSTEPHRPLRKQPTQLTRDNSVLFFQSAYKNNTATTHYAKTKRFNPSSASPTTPPVSDI